MDAATHGQAIELQGRGHAGLEGSDDDWPQGCGPSRAGSARVGGSHGMHEKWIFSSTFLPYIGEPIDFMLEDRSQPIHGTFSDGVFHSRWADYDAGRVASWRESDGEPFVAVDCVPKPVVVGGFAVALRRMGRIFSRANVAAPSAPTRSHARVISAPTIPVRAAARPVDSNLMSS